jgi:rhamnogalacturonyl hydrolase YesR
MAIIKAYLSCLVIALICISCYAEEDSSVTRLKLLSVVNAVLNDATFNFISIDGNTFYKSLSDIPDTAVVKPGSAYNDWRYWNGVLNISMVALANTLDDYQLNEFAVENVEFGFNSYSYFEERYKGENKWSYPFGQFFIMKELDDCGAIGASVIEVYKTDKQDRYKSYIDSAAFHILNRQARLNDGTLVRSFPEQWTLWADDLYMANSFLSRMYELTGNILYADFAARQVIKYHLYLFDDGKGIMTHCWYSQSDKRGIAFWGRANGWALVAQIDLLERLPDNYPDRDMLVQLMIKHIRGIVSYQSKSGLWHQLLDKNDSYLETSCSAMFTYTIARAVNKGLIDQEYSKYAHKGWNGVMSKIRSDGMVEGVCTGTVVSEDLDDYYNRPAPLNDVHGIGTVLLAGAEMLRLENNTN